MTGGGAMRTTVVVLALLTQPCWSVAVTVSVAGPPAGLVVKSTNELLLLSSVPLVMVQVTFDQPKNELFGSGGSMYALPREPAQIASGYWCSTGGGMVRMMVVAVPLVAQPWSSVAVTDSVAGV